ncbi:alpha/beta fold hydrolase [Saccharothrix violaceirubra]|uniref:Pimeloyl-ACP methyl ester carboxylesterase n=1 Tax=Saccharothrix violaceirubra TaxID=413306 RepID=A0A7W7T330_9PSEU|nr:alpha/beta fold hydrolase [Saccharothrix violaceirubra]MBB4965663.1 pimeloyl-ACP methyl ester carboxylesterase [Saccharothrix violaceirubra]
MAIPVAAQAESPRDDIDWTASGCPTGLDCGTLELPVDWARPHGETFRLALARRPAVPGARRIGVLVVVPGGPGDSGVDHVSRFRDPALDGFDIVGFDARGIKRSSPVVCSADVLARRPATPVDQPGFDRLVAYNRELHDDCVRHTGPIADHVDTGSVVRDLEAVRRALGEPKISLFGHSYGTLLGLAYAERHGDRLRALALTGLFDHSQDTGGFLRTSAVAVEDAFHQFVRWCDTTPSCALHGRDVVAAWDDLLARADRGEVPGQTAESLSIAAHRSFYGPDHQTLANLIAGAPARSATTTPYPFQAIFCDDFRVKIRDYAEFSRYADQQRRLAPHMRGALRQFGAVTSCIGWSDRVSFPQHLLTPHRGTPPILLMNSRHDPAGLYSWAREVERQARGRATLVTYEGPGHNVYPKTSCTTTTMHRYLVDLTVPTTTSCPA